MVNFDLTRAEDRGSKWAAYQIMRGNATLLELASHLDRIFCYGEIDGTLLSVRMLLNTLDAGTWNHDTRNTEIDLDLRELFDWETSREGYDFWAECAANIRTLAEQYVEQYHNLKTL